MTALLERPVQRLVRPLLALCAIATVVWLVLLAEGARGAFAAEMVHELGRETTPAPRRDFDTWNDEIPADSFAPQADEDAGQLAAPDDDVSPAERRRMLHDREYYRQLRGIASPTDYHRSQMSSLERRNRYPRSNRRFTTPEEDPVLRQRVADVRTRNSEDGKTSLTVWSDSNVVPIGSTLTIYAMHSQRSEAGRGESAPLMAGMTGELRREGGEVISTLSFVDPDGDGTFHAQMSMSEQAIRPGIYKAHVHSFLDLHEVLAFGVRNAKARITGVYRDRVDRGDLLVLAEIEVDAPGNFHVHGTLYGGHETAIGDSTSNHELERGRHLVPLRFDGRLLHDAGTDGPYRLAQLSVSSRGSVGPDVSASPNFETAAYPLATFDSALFNPLE
jgi:hypothetical protein